MGTVFTLDIRDPGDWGAAIAEVLAWLHHVDRVFSTYQAGSDISRIQRRELRAEDADPDVLTVLELCAESQAVTHGYFTAMANRRLDPTGLVKGWAVERASMLLREHGAANHGINGGGDIQLAGLAEPGRPWHVGISAPFDSSAVLATIASSDLAVATSGLGERGNHIIDPFTGRPATAWASATVLGPSLTCADAYATAALVMGADAIRWAGELPGYDLLLVGTDRSQLTTDGWRNHLA